MNRKFNAFMSFKPENRKKRNEREPITHKCGKS